MATIRNLRALKIFLGLLLLTLPTTLAGQGQTKANGKSPQPSPSAAASAPTDQPPNPKIKSAYDLLPKPKYEVKSQEGKESGTTQQNRKWVNTPNGYSPPTPPPEGENSIQVSSTCTNERGQEIKSDDPNYRSCLDKTNLNKANATDPYNPNRDAEHSQARTRIDLGSPPDSKGGKSQTGVHFGANKDGEKVVPEAGIHFGTK